MCAAHHDEISITPQSGEVEAVNFILVLEFAITIYIPR